MKKAIGVMIFVFLLLVTAACQKTEENEKKETMQGSEKAMADAENQCS